MLGFFRSAQEVVAVSLVENLVGFVSAKKLTPGKTVKLKLLINTSEGTEFFTSSSTIAEVEAKPEGGFLCSAILKCKPDELQTLTQLATLAGLEGACRRRSARLDYTARAISKQLPNFRAVTVNINLSGALILCDGPVEPGKLLVLQLNLENVDMGELTVEVESIWTDREPFDGKSYKVGVVLTPQPKRVLDIWTTLYSAVGSVEGGNVMQRTMGNPTAPPGSNINQSRHTPQHGFVAPPSPGGSEYSAPQQPDPYTSGGYATPAAPQQSFTPPAPANPYGSGGYTAPPVSPTQHTPSFSPPGQPMSAPSLNFGNSAERSPQFQSPNFSSQEPVPPPQQPAQPGRKRSLSLDQPGAGSPQRANGNPTGFTSSSSLNFSGGGTNFTPPPPPQKSGPGFAPPAASGPGSGAISPPSLPGSAGQGFTPPPAPGAGFQPPPPPGPPGVGFTPPSPPGGGFVPPSLPGSGAGFTPPPPPGGQFKPPSLPGGQRQGFIPPPPPPGGFQPPPPPPRG